MKKILFSLLIVTALFSCKDDDDAPSVDTSLLVGKWEMVAQYRGGQTPTKWDNDCFRDKWWEFKADGTVFNSNPCASGHLVDKDGTWTVKGNIMYIQGMVQLPAVPVIKLLSKERLIIEYPYGSFETIYEHFVPTDRERVDYAGDAAGEYIGVEYFSTDMLTDVNPGTETENQTVIVEKIAPNMLKYTFKNFTVLDGIQQTIAMDSLITESIKGERSAYMVKENGFDEIKVQDVKYNVSRSNATFYLKDEAEEDIRITFEVERLGVTYSYHRFIGKRVVKH